MKKTTFPLLLILFALFMAACREGGSTGQTPTDTMQDTLQTSTGAVAAPVDSLATELDQTAEDIEQQTNELKSALDSL